MDVEILSHDLLFGERQARLVLANDITERKQAEEALRGSEAQLNDAQRLAKSGSWTWEPSVQLTWSENMFALFGIPDNEPPTFEKFLARVMEEDRKRVMDGFQAFLTSTRTLERVEYQIVGDDGEPITIQAIGYVERDDSGVAINVAGTVQDITERKRAEEKVQRQNLRLSALREIDTAILAADSVENIVGAALSHIRELIECQRAVLSLIDWGANETVVFDVRTVNETSIPQGTRVPLALFQDISQTLSKNQPALTNDLRALADPPPLFQSLIKEGLRSVCILPLFSQDNLIGAFSLSSEIPGFFDEEKINLGREVANQVAIAITQSRLVEALQHLNADLEQRVRERENLIAELTAKNAELERFIYIVSHDLKSPLVTMKGFLGYLEQDAMTGNLERLKGDSHRIASAVDKMQELLNDVLELSRIGRFVNPLETIPFEELAHEAIGLVGGRRICRV